MLTWTEILGGSPLAQGSCGSSPEQGVLSYYIGKSCSNTCVCNMTSMRKACPIVAMQPRKGENGLVYYYAMEPLVTWHVWNGGLHGMMTTRLVAIIANNRDRRLSKGFPIIANNRRSQILAQ